MDNSFDLQQLKAQFEILNNKLNQQQIVNERIIRASVNSRCAASIATGVQWWLLPWRVALPLLPTIIW